MTGSDAADDLPDDPEDSVTPDPPQTTGTLRLDTSLRSALGPASAAALATSFGMATVGDLLSHYPRKYARRGELTTRAELPLDESVTVLAEVLDVRVMPPVSKPGKKP
ncbi:MAG: hypothetical protein ABWY68_11095, partial [Cryobacterium sp.]